MAKRKKKSDKRKMASVESYLRRGNLKEWKSDDDYESDAAYWRSSAVRQRSPRGYDAFLSREQAWKDAKNVKKKEQQRKQKPEEYTYNDRASGDFRDIRGALREDAGKGKAAAAEFKNKQPPSLQNRQLIRDLRAKRNQGLGTGSKVNGKDISGAQQNIAKALGIKGVDSQSDLQQIQAYNASQTNNPNTMSQLSFSQEQKNIAKLLGINVLDSANDLRQINEAQAAASALGIQGIDSQNDIRQIREYNAANPPVSAQPTPAAPTLEDLLIQQQAGFDAQIAGLEGQLGQANSAYAAAQQQMQAQLQAATAATFAAEKRAANMRNAFVPQANPSAMTVAYGDQRINNRDRANNQLSDLTIMSGLGTASNPLAGLQLA